MHLRDLAGRSKKEQLHRIETVTDAALAHLDLEELLAELLDRVKELLTADTAAVLLTDPQGRELVVTAASGLEEEGYEGVRIPVGKGFAGRIARLRKPVIIDRVDETNMVNPILVNKGICSLLGVPLLVEGDVLGVLHVGTLTSRRFTDDDADLLQVVADRAALAVQSRVSQTERAAAQALQRSLLPTALPAMPGLHVAARYLPAHRGGTGGDWYDLFTLPSGRLGLVIGDVVGHGLDAALVMGRLRAGLRACSFDTDDPAKVLERLDRQIQHFEPGVMATLLYATLDPSLQWVSLSSAGHPFPVLALPDQPATPLDIPLDFPLGVRTKRPRRTTTVSLLPGAVMTFYTDGLVERRGSSSDTRLQELYKAVVAGPAETVCNTVVHSMINRYAPEDDASVLVVRRDTTASRTPVAEILFAAGLCANGEHSATRADLATIDHLLQGASRRDRAAAAIRAVLQLIGPDMCNIQLLDRADGSLKISAHHGFHDPFLTHFARVADDSTACGAAMEGGELIVVDDVANSPIFVETAGLDVMLEARARAVESMPYITPEGELAGIISMHHRTPGRRPKRELMLLRLIAGRLGALW